MIPDYQKIMLPLLRMVGDGAEHKFRDAIEKLAGEFRLSKEQREELLPSRSQPIFNNRVGWARTYLKKAGLIESTRRGYFKISKRGKEVLKNPLLEINNMFLRQFSEFVEFQKIRHEDDALTTEREATAVGTPDEIIENAYARFRASLASDILAAVRECSPTFFERLVVNLLVQMGYGGSRKDAGEAIGRSGDGGIDGIIKEDRLGLDIVYIQAKRWKDGNTVGSPEIQKFAGALQGRRARKGVFITTSAYSKDAAEFASNIESKIVLIDGARLAELMIDFNIGVITSAQYELKKIDADFFAEEEA